MSDVNINIRLITAAAEANAKKLATSIGRVDNNLKGAEKSAKSFGSSLGSVGTIARGVFLGNIIQTALFTIAGAVNDVVFAFGKFEQQLVAIGKTTGIEGQALKDLGDDFQELSKTIPVTSEELLGLGAIAGQLGVEGSENILKFTETVARLGASVEGASAEEFAKQLARIAQLTGTPIDQIDRLASSLVGLGNNVAANEAEISTIALRLSSATKQFDLSADAVLGLSATFAEIGISAELGGSATLRILRSITDAAADGGAALDKYVEITGLTVDQFRNLAQNSPQEAIFELSKGLNKLAEKDAVAVTKALEVLNLNELRAATAVNGLAGSYERLGTNLGRATRDYNENTAALEESNKAFSTQQSQIQLLQNQYTALAQELSEGFAPVLLGIVSRLRTVVAVAGQAADAFRSLVSSTNEASAADRQFNGQDLNAALEIRRDIISDISEEIRKQQKVIVDRQSIIDSAIGEEIAANEALKKQELEKLNRLKSNLALQEQRAAAIQRAIEAEQAEGSAPGGGDATPAGLPSLDASAEYYRQQEELRRIFRQGQIEQSQIEAEEQNAINEFRRTGELNRLQEFYLEQETLRQQDKIDAAKNEEEKQKILEDISKRSSDRVSKFKEKKKQDDLSTEREVQNGLVSLARAGSKEALALAQAVALRRALINVPESASNAYTYGTGIGGPILGGVFAAAATAAQLANVANIRSAGSFQNGGIVPGNNINGDRVTARVNSGEMILNRSQQAQLFQQANGQGGTGQNTPTEVVVNNVVELDGDVVFKSVSRQVADGKILGENQ